MHISIYLLAFVHNMDISQYLSLQNIMQLFQTLGHLTPMSHVQKIFVHDLSYKGSCTFRFDQWSYLSLKLQFPSDLRNNFAEPICHKERSVGVGVGGGRVGERERLKVSWHHSLLKLFLGYACPGTDKEIHVTNKTSSHSPSSFSQFYFLPWSLGKNYSIRVSNTFYKTSIYQSPYLFDINYCYYTSLCIHCGWLTTIYQEFYKSRCTCSTPNIPCSLGSLFCYQSSHTIILDLMLVSFTMH